MGWSTGFTTDWDEGVERGVDTPLGDFNTFPEAIRALHAYATDPDVEHEVPIYDIEVIMDDPGIMDDPDQWEDQEFNTESTTFWITEF